MKEISVSNKCTVKVYSSIKELPIELSKKFNAYLLQDAGIGNTIESIDDHLAKIMLFVQADKKSEAIEEAKNMRYSLFSMLSEWDYKSVAFGCLVHSVNGREITDHSSEGISAMIGRLSAQGLTVGMLDDVLTDVKKNLIPSANFSSLSTLVKT